jgi:Lar family restriction alleviation protein
MGDLKPCPFCGQPRIEVERETERNTWMAICMRCGASGPPVDPYAHGHRASKRMAAECWNARAAARPPREEE